MRIPDTVASTKAIAKIGHITPSCNTALEHVTALATAPFADLVSNHFTRIPVGTISLSEHVPIEVVDGEVRIPITTSREIAAATLERLELDGATITFASLVFGLSRPSAAQYASHHHGSDTHSDGEHPH